jgi:hypothetical protein
MGIVLHYGREEGTGPSIAEEVSTMLLQLNDRSVVLLVLRKDGQDTCHQIQGVAIADNIAEAEKQAQAICRDSTYYWIGPVPPNCAFPHTAFHLERNYPTQRPDLGAGEQGQEGSGQPH